MGREGTRCHHFWRILRVACSRFAEEVVCPCLYLLASSYQLVGGDRAVVKRMRTPLHEVGHQSALVVVGQHGDSPSSLELGVWPVADAVEIVATLALVLCIVREALRS